MLDKVANYMQTKRFKWVWELFLHLLRSSESGIGTDCHVLVQGITPHPPPRPPHPASWSDQKKLFCVCVFHIYHHKNYKDTYMTIEHFLYFQVLWKLTIYFSLFAWYSLPAFVLKGVYVDKHYLSLLDRFLVR